MASENHIESCPSNIIFREFKTQSPTLKMEDILCIIQIDFDGATEVPIPSTNSGEGEKFKSTLGHQQFSKTGHECDIQQE